MVNDRGSDASGQLVRAGELLGAFGLGSIVVIVIGRLWTISYFDYYGLSTGDLEFSVEDFAFRSVEVFVALGLAAIGFIVASRGRSWFVAWGPGAILLEVAIVSAALFVMYVGVLGTFFGWDIPNYLTFPDDWLAQPGVLGVITGVTLLAMIILLADIWFGSATGDSKIAIAEPDVWNLVWVSRYRILAALALGGILFIYLPIAVESLARLDARLDLERRRLPVAILETIDAPLPTAIASFSDPTRSNLVRVVLAQRENTYVLNSTDCTAIGEAKLVSEGKRVFSSNRDVCSVFAIPTNRLKSVEYVGVTGKRPANNEPAQAIKMSFTEPLLHVVSTNDASDAEGVSCPPKEGEPSFQGTVWYEVPARGLDGALRGPGVLLAMAATDDFPDEIAIIVYQEDEAGALQAAACQTETQLVTTPDGSGSPSTAVATRAQLQDGTTYLVAVGSLEKGRGDVEVRLEFFRDALLFSDGEVSDELRPNIELTPILGRVELEARAFNAQTGAMEAIGQCSRKAADGAEEDAAPTEAADGGAEPADGAGDLCPRFELQQIGGTSSVPFGIDLNDEDPERTTFVAESIFPPGSWTLKALDPFDGIATVIVPPNQPDLVIAIEGSLGSDVDDLTVQTFIMLALDEANYGSELGLTKPVLFDRVSFNAAAFENVSLVRDVIENAQEPPEESADAGSNREGEPPSIRALWKLYVREQNAVGRPAFDGRIGIETVQQPQLSVEDETILGHAALSLTLILNELFHVEDTFTFAVTTECDFCIRIFRIQTNVGGVRLESGE